MSPASVGDDGHLIDEVPHQLLDPLYPPSPGMVS